MTIENDSVIDIIGIEPDGTTVVLTISDHLDWTNTVQHQFAIQKKLNRYLAFVESGELLERYPKARGLAVEFEIVFQYRPDRKGQAFLSKAKQIIESAGFALSTRVFAESYEN